MISFLPHLGLPFVKNMKYNILLQEMYPFINKLFYNGCSYIKSKAEMVTNLFWKQLLDVYSTLL